MAHSSIPSAQAGRLQAGRLQAGRLQAGRLQAGRPCELSFVLRCRDDEERIGHTIQRVAAHLRGLGLSFELLLVDEGSGDNTLAIAALLRPSHPELQTMHAEPGCSFLAGAHQARGRVVVLYDVRAEASLAALGYTLGRIERGLDVVALGGRFLAFRRTRALRAFDTLTTSRRDMNELETRFIRRARAVGLGATLTHPRRRSALERLREAMPRIRSLSFLF